MDRHGPAEAVGAASEGQVADATSEVTTTPSPEVTPLIFWKEATATVTRLDGASVTVKASTVGPACTTGRLMLTNGYETRLERVRTIRFVAVHAEIGRADGTVTILDGREPTDAIHTAHCPVVGTDVPSAVDVPCEEVRRIDFHR